MMKRNSKRRISAYLNLVTLELIELKPQRRWRKHYFCLEEFHGRADSLNAFITQEEAGRFIAEADDLPDDTTRHAIDRRVAVKRFGGAYVREAEERGRAIVYED